MNTTEHVSETLRRVLTQPKRGVVGLVDDLLAACRDQRLQLDWRSDRCRVRPDGGEWAELTDVPLSKSAFRAVLARVAALCNERTPGAVSPYGGHGELPAVTDPRDIIKITFLNTPTEQTLELTTETDPADSGSQSEPTGATVADHQNGDEGSHIGQESGGAEAKALER